MYLLFCNIVFLHILCRVNLDQISYAFLPVAANNVHTFSNCYYLICVRIDYVPLGQCCSIQG